MKKHKFKKRFIILGIVIFLIVFFMGYYINYIGDTYDMHTGIFGLSYDDIEVQMKTSRDDVVVLSDYEVDENGELVLELRSDDDGEVDADITVSIEKGERYIPMKTHFSVNDMGTIVENRYGNLNCNGYMEITIAFLVMMLLILIVMVASFIECLNKNWFSYSMIVYGGVALYIFGLLVLMGYKILNSAVTSLSALLVLIGDVGSYFLVMMLPVMALMAVSVSVSNIWLMRHEGYRPVNALGIVISVVWLVGLCAVLNIGYLGSFMYSTPVLSRIRVIATYVICYFESMLVSLIVCAFTASRHEPPLDRDYIIILGCAIRSDGSLTPLLKGRVDSALSFEKRQYDASGKHACFVPSGGQGADEVISEGEAMERYLLEQGVPAERIIREDKSTSTFENMKLSREVVEKTDPDFVNKKTAFATTNYHVFRGYILSKKNGFEAQGISAKTKWYFFPNAFLREFIGLTVDKISVHIIFLVALAAIVAAIEYFI
nr:YdcF family protein [uncultured Ruminococcus sp.]